jgi:hypothetical protein
MNWQLRKKVRNLRILAGILSLLSVYAWMGKSDSDARLDEVRHMQTLQSSSAVTHPLQRNAAAVNPTFRGEI